MRIESIGKWIISHWFEITILIFSFCYRFWIYNRTPFAPGWDSYFYIVQIKSFIEEGVMHSSRLSLFYPLLITVQYLVNNYELTYKLTAALLTGVFSLQMFRAARSLNNNSNLTYIAAGYTMVSPQLTYFAAQYSKNLLGAIFFLWLLEVLNKPKHLKNGSILLTNLFIHKLTAGVSIILWLLQYMVNRINKKILVLTGIGSIALIIIGWSLPILFSFEDFHREGMGLTTTFNWPSFTLLKTFKSLIDTPWLIDIIICNILYITALASLLWKSDNYKKWLPVLVILSVLTFPFLQWSLTGLSFRALMLFLILCPLLICMVNIKLNQIVLYNLSLLLVIFGLLASQSYSPQKHDPPYALYKSIAYQIDNFNDIDFKLIIAHKALAEYVTFKTSIDVLPWEPEYKVETKKLWRICTGINQKSIQFFGQDNYKKELVYKLNPNYSLIREDLWDVVLMNIEKEDHEYYEELTNWKNPYIKRPNYMLQYKKRD